MVEKARKGWENPIAKQHVVGFGVGVVAMAIFCFGYPGWFMSRSAAEEQRVAQADQIRASYCLASYLGSGVTAEEAGKLRSKGTGEQADILVKTGHAPDVDAGRACGKQLDQLNTDAEIGEAIKKATMAAAARNAKIAAGDEASGVKQN